MNERPSSGIDNFLLAAYRNRINARRHGFTQDDSPKGTYQHIPPPLLDRFNDLGFSEQELTRINRKCADLPLSQHGDQRAFRISEIERDALLSKIRALQEEIEMHEGK